MTKFTIAIPCYKDKFLDETIDSILSQSFKDFEIVIVNDASPFNIDAIIAKYNDPRIKYFRNETNCGAINVVDNWNKCLSYATGEYIICMGDDDKLLPTCLEEYVKLIELYPGLGVYHTWTEIIDENSNIIRMQEARPLYEGVYSMMWGRWNGRTQFIGDFLFERKLLMNNGGFYKLPLAWASDDISAYIAARKNGIANMQVPGFQYRANSQSISRTGDAAVKLNAIMNEEFWYKHFLVIAPGSVCIAEQTYYKMLTADLKKVIVRKKVHTIAQSMTENGLISAFSFWKKRKTFGLDTKLIIYAMIEAIKRKQVKSNNKTI